VLVRGRQWTVLERTAFSSCAAVRLHACDQSVADRTLLTPFDRISRIDSPARVNVVRPRRWLHAVRRLGTTAHPFGGLTTAAGSEIDILPYQLEPALAVVRGAPRIMIADAVGLGKTVQAGLILNELAARGGESFRALVVTPAGLRDQWCRELADRFSLPVIVCGAAWLAQTTRDLPAGISPWVLPAVYITSFDFLKRAEVLRPLEEVTWDALVVDEAHNASAGTARRAAIDAVARRSRRVILLTATPHAGDASQFDALCRIGQTEARPERLLIFHRSRQDAGVARARRSVLLAVGLSAPERRMHRLLGRYTARVCREAAARGDARARLAAIVLQKRALSSAASLAASAGRRIELLAGIASPSERQLRLPLADEDSLPDEEPDGVLAAPGLTDSAGERDLLRSITAAAQVAARDESKTRVLLRFLKRTGEAAIVFTEYRDTLARLQGVLAAAGLQAATIHGGQSPAERASAQRAFNDSGMLLLATDAAAEGLNLHARCRTVVHYELPWSPARIEQRTGRVDRIGQQRAVHEILLVARDTAERIVLAPLARRAARARAALSGSSRMLELLTESRVAAAVLEGTALDEPAAPNRDPDGSIDEAPAGSLTAARDEAARLRLVRRWFRSSSHSAPRRSGAAGPLVCVMKAPPRARGATCVYRMALSGEDGRAAHTELIAVHDPECAAPSSSRRRAAREALDAWLLAREPAVRTLLLAGLAERISRITTSHGAAVAALEEREAAIARAVPSAARELVQAGLFDSRAVRAHQARRRAAGTLLEESEQRLRSLGSAERLALTIDVAAVLWGGRRR
jgi:superfamily II DNA or RNA helicase